MLRNKLQTVMAFQIYAYYVNHYAVNENNSILSAIFGWINWSV